MHALFTKINLICLLTAIGFIFAQGLWADLSAQQATNKTENAIIEPTEISPLNDNDNLDEKNHLSNFVTILKLDVEKRLEELLNANFSGHDTREFVTQKISEIKVVLAKFYAILPQEKGQFPTESQRNRRENFHYFVLRTENYLYNVITAYNADDKKKQRRSIEKLVTLGCRSCHENFVPKKISLD